jgi:hypothetical protein
MSVEIEWRPVPTALNESEAALGFKFIKAGEHQGLFIPAQSELGQDKACDRKLAELALGAGLLTGTGYIAEESLDFMVTSDRSSGLGVHVDLLAQSPPMLTVHGTKIGTVIGMLARPKAAYIRPFEDRSRWFYESCLNRSLTDALMSGIISDDPIEPIVEYAIASKGDRVAFMSQTLLGEEEKALPVAHWFVTLTKNRISRGNVYGAHSD